MVKTTVNTNNQDVSYTLRLGNRSMQKTCGKKGVWGGIPPSFVSKKRVVPKLTLIGSNLFFLFLIGH